MYRKASSTSVLSGVPSGIYTGGKRVIDGAQLEPATRARFDKVLSMRGHPAPIAYERPAAVASSRPVWGIIAAVMGLLTLSAIGFGNLDSDWGMQPWWSLTLYLALGFFFASSLLPLLRRRALLGGGARGALRPGRYLFPLDAIEIDRPDATGRQLVRVYPLGDARQADISIEGKRVDLLIRFEDGETVRFPLRGDHKGTVALRRLEHAQRLLEDLTYKSKLEEAFANDLLFDVRVDNAWERLKPGTGPGPVRAPNVLSLALGRYAPAVVAVITLALGAGTFVVRREAGDTALYNHAVAYGSMDALDRYLARGGTRRLAIQDLKTRLVDAEKERVLREEERRNPSSLDGFRYDAVEEARIDERCVANLEAHASTAHPKSVPALIRAVVKSRSRALHFSLHAGPQETPQADSVFNLGRQMNTDNHVLAAAFSSVMSELCPVSVLAVEITEYIAYEAMSISVTAMPHWLTTWHVLDAKRQPFDVQQLAMDFHVDLLEHGKPVESFDLSVPPPPEPQLGLRPQSLFSIGGDPLPPGLFDQRVYSAMVARAYDRLYDELWSLFFTGDPRVPLVPAAVLTP